MNKNVRSTKQQDEISRSPRFMLQELDIAICKLGELQAVFVEDFI